MDLVEVHVVHLQPLQARLDGLDEVGARVAALVGAWAHLAERLGRDHHAVARHLEVAQRLAGDLL